MSKWPAVRFHGGRGDESTTLEEEERALSTLGVVFRRHSVGIEGSVFCGISGDGTGTALERRS
jgi:hypothetical protein